ncbi:hypothetical protein [Streptomyces triticirhizae]|uniref:Uncharacterized protein n=1 Tax=Streptomyces triticirhizae TaxID=2483353 RepID=A0A3M2M555_9ACTN|nr:hypothetical protein [Streptomyces triticirhizae]RMI44817.1 hypothetical protein EBN88_04345 [Streptomyces triticirhizae]
MGPRRTRSTIALLGVLLGGLVACGDDPADESSATDLPVTASESYHVPQISRDGWPEEVPSRGLTAGMRLPVEDYLSSYAEMITLLQARDTAEIACMVSSGFTNWETEPLGTSPPPENNSVRPTSGTSEHSPMRGR